MYELYDVTSGVDVTQNRRKYEIFSLESVRRDILGIARVPSESGCQGRDVAHFTCHVSVSGHVDHVTLFWLSIPEMASSDLRHNKFTFPHFQDSISNL